MSETLYVVCKIGYEYNDEIYYAPETDTAVPVKAYRSKEKADAEANKLNLKEFRDIEIEGYSYDLEGLFPTDYIRGKSIINVDISEYDFHDKEDVAEFIAKANDEELTKLVALMDIKFYEVREIKLVD